MSPETLVAIVGGLIATAGLLILIMRRLPKKIRQSHYTRKWRDIQKLCGDKNTWPDAIVNADDLLNEVLKKKRKEGKTMGERMVSAQKDFSSNDSVWKAHKLANSLRQKPEVDLKETEVKDSLIAFRSALKDLGAV